MTADVERAHLEEIVESAFRPIDSTLKLLELLIEYKMCPLDLVTLVTARLDGLASLYDYREHSSHKRFVNFVLDFGGYRNVLNSISVPDLYTALMGRRRVLGGLIPEPGRVVARDESDVRFFDMIYDISDLSITSEAVDHFLQRLTKALSSRYRVFPKQSLRKPYLDSLSNVLSVAVGALETPHYEKYISSFESAFKNWASSYRLVELLYKKCRNQSIHGIVSPLYEQGFFRETEPYIEEYSSLLASGTYSFEFPAPFLQKLLSNASTQFKIHLKSKSDLPEEVHYLGSRVMMDADEVIETLHLIDQDSISSVVPGKIRFPRAKWP